MPDEAQVYFPPKSGPLFDQWRKWLRDNAVDTRRVIRDSPVWVNGDTITVVEFVFDERGSRAFHARDCGCEHGEGHYAKHKVTYRMTKPLGVWAQLDRDDETMDIEGDRYSRGPVSIVNHVATNAGKPEVVINGQATQNIHHTLRTYGNRGDV